MSGELIKYDAACRLIAEAAAVDEVVDIIDQAAAMREYARRAKNRSLEIDAAQIRMRAERRLGEMILAQKATVGLAKGGQPYQGDSTCSDAEQVERPPTLQEAGIDRKLSSRAQRIAEIGGVRFEALLAMVRNQGDGRVILDVLKIDAEREQREARRNLAQALSETSADLPTGQLFACAYIDPPWQRKQGVTSRSYENHYPTMAWDEILALMARLAEILQPDAWVFLWVPRAHMFALHPVDMEFADDDGRVITRKVKLPLAWAVARAAGCDSYSTAFVWTKTDEAFPRDHGGGVVVYDQDEILLLFKRGRGLPKPATDEKFNSNHRERKREHSRKPDHYREMIRTMTGGVPVLELFARVDAEHPLPPDWHAWGNQAVPIVADAAPETAASSQPCAAAGLPALPDALRHSGDGIVDQAGTASLGAGDAVPPAERPGNNFLAVFEATLPDDEFYQWLSLDLVRHGYQDIDRESARGLIGSGHLAVVLDRLALTEPGIKLLRSIEQFVERSERREGRTVGVDLAAPPPRQVDLEELLSPAEPPLEMPPFLTEGQEA